MNDAQDRSRALAVRFAQQLLSVLGVNTMREIDRRNADGLPGNCASHDFCDANMVMESAFVEIYGHSSLSDDGLSDLNAARWNAAWRVASAAGFLKLIDEALAESRQFSMAQERWRIVVTSPSGVRSPYCKGTFATSDAASSWISRERLHQRNPGCTLEVEPDILAVRPR